MYRTIRVSAALLVVYLGTVAAEAQDRANPLFTSESPLELTITGPLRGLTRDERDAVLELTAADGTPVALDIEIRVRGKTRLEYCDYPPLSIDFSSEQVVGTVFEGQSELKLVTLCKHSDRYRDYLVEEFQIYRLLNELTGMSFRARWANVEFVYDDSDRRTRTFVEPAFFIEDVSEVAQRHGLEVIERERLDRDALDPRHSALLAVFQYTIGNTDWDLTDADGDESCCHNGKVVGSGRGSTFVLPYDFDQAGFINTEYSAPSEQLSIRSVVQRVYRGYCRFNDEIDAVIAHMNDRRARWSNLLMEEFTDLRVRDSRMRYLDRSFDLLNDSRRVQRELLDECIP